MEEAMGHGSLHAAHPASSHAVRHDARRRPPTAPFVIVLALCGAFWMTVVMVAVRLAS
jgi:hypothetical protein